MRRVVFDSNAIDPIADTPGALELLQEEVAAGHLEVLYTHITVDELGAIKDPELRSRLTLAMTSLGHLVPTGDFVIGFSRLDYARLGSDETAVSLENFRSSRIGNTADALIASAARHEQCAVVTRDQRLTGRAREEGIEVLTPAALLEEFGFPPS